MCEHLLRRGTEGQSCLLRVTAASGHLTSVCLKCFTQQTFLVFPCSLSGIAPESAPWFAG